MAAGWPPDEMRSDEGDESLGDNGGQEGRPAVLDTGGGLLEVLAACRGGLSRESNSGGSHMFGFHKPFFGVDTTRRQTTVPAGIGKESPSV